MELCAGIAKHRHTPCFPIPLHRVPFVLPCAVSSLFGKPCFLSSETQQSHLFACDALPVLPGAQVSWGLYQLLQFIRWHLVVGDFSCHTECLVTFFQTPSRLSVVLQ